MVNVEHQRGSVELHNGHEKSTKRGVGQGLVVILFCAGRGRRGVDGGRDGAKTGGERRKEAAIGLVGAVRQGSDVVSVGHGWFGEVKQVGGGVKDGYPDVSLEVPDGPFEGCGGNGSPEVGLHM